MDTIIDVGGGMRDIYGAGVFDRCLDDGVSFDCCIGISAGAANVCSYLARQKGRNYRFYHDYSFRKEYMSPSAFLKNGSFVDLDYVYSVLSNSDGEDPLDYETLHRSNARMFIVATDAVTATPVYFTKDDMQQDNYEILKASGCLPNLCKPRRIGYQALYDGGLSDPLPVDKALEDGCDRLVVLLTRPIDYTYRHDSKKETLLKTVMRTYPKTAKAIFSRHDKYDESLKKVLRLEAEGKALIVAPDDCCGVDTLKRSPDALDRLYQKGYADGEKIKSFLSAPVCPRQAG